MSGFTGLSDAVEGGTSRVLSLHRETKFIIGLDVAVTLSSPDSFLCSFRHHFRTICQKMIPFIMCEVSFG